MTAEEIEAYVEKIEETPIGDIKKILPNADSYNIDVDMRMLCDALAETINIYRNLNIENGNHELDEEILDLEKKYYICIHYLDEQNDRNNSKKNKAHKIVFAKTPSGNPYFNIDLEKVPSEVYDEVKKTLNLILNGVNMADKTKVKLYSDIKFPQKVLTFKGFQVRIYTTKLKGNILCVFGLKVKKSDYPKSIKAFLERRLHSINQQIDNLRAMIADTETKNEILADSKDILDKIMHKLDKDFSDDDVELLFPSDEELDQLIPFVDFTTSDDEKNDSEMISLEPTLPLEEDQVVENSVKIEKIPETAKKVTKRRGPYRKTVARKKISDSLRGFTFDELTQIQAFIDNMKKDKEINKTFNSIYDGLLNMSADQLSQFEQSVEHLESSNTVKRK